MARKPIKKKQGPMAPKKTFYKVRDGFLYCVHYADGATVMLTESQARYPLMSRLISRTPPKPAAPVVAPVAPTPTPAAPVTKAKFSTKADIDDE